MSSLENVWNSSFDLLKSFADAISYAIIIWDQKGTVRHVNAEAKRLLGRARESVVGLVYDDPAWNRTTIDGKPFPKDLLPVSKVLREKAPVYGVKYAFEQLDGTKIVVSSDASPLGNTVLEVLRDITEEERTVAQAQYARLYAENIVDNVRDPLIVLDHGLRVVSANRSFYEAFKVSPEKTEGRVLYDLGECQWDIPELRRSLDDIRRRRITSFNDLEVDREFPSIGRRILLLNAREIFGQTVQARRERMILVAVEDVTDRKTAERELKHAYDKEHYIAQTLQDSLLLPVPAISGLEIGVVYESSFAPERAGGDFYDVFMLSEKLVAMLIGDVSGKGVGAAVLASTVRTAVRALAQLDSSPSFILTHANQSLIEQTKPGIFVTGLLMVLDLETGGMSWSNAGHPPPIICAGECSPLALPHGLPLGSFPGAYEEFRGILERGQTILLYTDGLIEARHDMDLFGEDRVLGSLSSVDGKQPQAVVDRLLDDIKDFTHGNLHDDVAIIAVRFCG